MQGWTRRMESKTWVQALTCVFSFSAFLGVFIYPLVGRLPLRTNHEPGPVQGTEEAEVSRAPSPPGIVDGRGPLF